MAEKVNVDEERYASSHVSKIDRTSDHIPRNRKSSRLWHSAAAMTVASSLAISIAFVLVTLPANTTAEPHDPIYISGNSGFEDVISVSGVRSGTGVEGDPYIISDWEIIIVTEVVDEHGVWIRDTDKHFVIRNVTVTQTSYHATRNYNGIYLLNADNGTVEDCTLTGWLKKGIYTTGSTEVLIRNNTVSIEAGPSNDRNGIDVYSSPSVNVTVDGNNVTSGNYGIYVWYADDITVKNNRVSSVTDGGIVIYYSEDATVWNNTMTGCGIDLWIGSLAESNTHLIPQNNTVNGLPVHYIKDDTGILYDGDTVGQLIFANCVDISVSDMSFSDCDVGIQIYFCEGVSLDSVTVADTLYNGVTVMYTDDFEMTGSTISGCGRVGVELWSGVGLTVAGCTIESNLNNGMSITFSRQVNVTLCNISYNDNAMSCGIDYRVLNTAIDLQSTITYNEFRGNYMGVALSGCKGVTIHHNNFVDNTVQAGDTETNFNQWDDGAEGNYWSDYSGLDVSPPFGIGDTPYDIDGDTYDNYPLMDVHVIPEFGTLVVPVIVILGLFVLLYRKTKE